MQLEGTTDEKKKLSDALSDLCTISERIGRLKEEKDSYDIKSETWKFRKEIEVKLFEAETYKEHLIRENFYGLLK